jgi:hypothetical protein
MPAMYGAVSSRRAPCDAASPGIVTIGVPCPGVDREPDKSEIDRRPGGVSRRRALMRKPWIAAALCAAALPAACSGEPKPAVSPTPSASVSPSRDPLAGAEQELRAAEAAWYRAYQSAVADPGSERTVDRLLELYVPNGRGRRDIAARMDGLADRGYAGRPGPKGYQVVEDVSVDSVADGARAVVTVCSFDDGIVIDTRNDGPDGKPITVDDDVVGGRTKDRWVRQDGAWRLEGGDVVEQWKGDNRCPADPGG